MGKIRTKVLGDESIEKEQKKEAKKRQEAKKTSKSSDVANIELESSQVTSEEPAKEKKDSKKNKKNAESKHSRSRKYQMVKQMVDANKEYTLTEALKLLPQLKISSFDETVELHINTKETGVSGTVSLPHGTGKELRIVIADESVIANIEKGIINFDILLAAPTMMPKLAKVARILGPKGLMPNPKNGTISQDPEESAKKFAQGQVRFKTEAKAPVIHVTVGKLSFGEDKLAENITTMLRAIQASNIRNITLKSTMSPAIHLSVV